MQHAPLRVGIIGLGNMGSAHAACIGGGQVEGLTLAAVCDIDGAKRQTFAAAHPDVACFAELDDLLASGLVDVLVIATPHPLHAAMVRAGLDAGLHVLTEKPADIAVSRVQGLGQLAAERGLTFGIMFNQRTNPLFQRARQIVQSGQLGALRRTVWVVTNWYRTQHYYDSGDWRATWAGEGGGVLLNQAPHNLDLWQWICGMPRSVTAWCEVAKYHDIEVEDDAALLTRYENGATGLFLTSTGEFPGTNRLEITGDAGKLVLENGVLKWWKLERPCSEVIADSAKSFDEIPFTVEEYRQEGPETAHRGILQNFANAVLRGEELLAPGADGVYELTLSNAAYLSSWTGSVPVPLPLDTAAFDAELAARAASSRYTAVQSGKLGEGRYRRRWQVNW